MIGTSKNGIAVYAHPESHSHRPDLNKEVISKISLPENGSFHRETVNLGRVIGVDHLVETSAENKIVMFQRGNRPGLSRMVIDKSPDETSLVTVVLCVATDPDELAGKWVLVTLFEGNPGEREPFDQSLTEEGKAKSEAFWAFHALVPTEEELAQMKEAGLV